MEEQAYEIRPEVAEELISKMRTDLTTNCHFYLACSATPDEFGADHKARRVWREQMRKRDGDEFTRQNDRNKLRLNVVAALYSYLHGLADLLDSLKIDTAEAQRIRELAKKLPDLEGYGEKSNDDKLAVVAQMDEIARSFLELATVAE